MNNICYNKTNIFNVFSTVILCGCVFCFGQHNVVFGGEMDNEIWSCSLRTIADTRMDDIVVKAAKNSTRDVYVDGELVAKWIFASYFIDKTMLDEYMVEKMIEEKKHILVLYDPNDICQNNVGCIFAIEKGNGYHDIKIFFREEYLDNFFGDPKNGSRKYGVVFDDCLTELFYGRPPVESGFLIKGNFDHQFLQGFLKRDIPVMLVAPENPFPGIPIEYVFIPLFGIIIYIIFYFIFFRKFLSFWSVCLCFVGSCIFGYILSYKPYYHTDEPMVVHKLNVAMSALGIILGGLIVYLIMLLFKRAATKRATREVNNR